MLIHLLTLSLQINSLFHISEITQLLKPRFSSNKIITVYGDTFGFDAMIVSSKLPTHAILSFESNRMHIFIHDCECITNCIWDGNVIFDEKKQIINNMMEWWYNGTDNKLFNHRVVKYEDGLVFTEVLKELKCN